MSKTNNKMGVVQLTDFNAVNMMGSGIIMLPTKLAVVITITQNSRARKLKGGVSKVHADIK